MRAADILVKLDGLGLWSHSIPEAAKLIALDMFYSGQLENVKISADDLQFEPERDDDPRIISLLSTEITRVEGLLVKAVELGRLAALHVQRGFDEAVKSQGTYIDHEVLCDWLESRGYEIGDIISEWSLTESEIYSYIAGEIECIRIAQNESKKVLDDILFRKLRAVWSDESGKKDGLYASWKRAQEMIKILTDENKLLLGGRNGGTERNDGPLTTLSRRTHQTVIAALCLKCGIDWKGRGAANQIKRATEEIGAPVTDDTIKKILDELPESIESRMK